jgi:hypothetical protein
MDNRIDDLTAGLISRSQNINYVLIFAFTVLVLAALAKISNKDTIKIKDIEINFKIIQIVMAALTAAHLYAAYSFDAKVIEIVKTKPREQIVAAFEKLRDGPFFFQGLIPRISFTETKVGRVFKMDFSDPTTLLAIGAAVGAFVVMIRWRNLSAFERLRNLVGSATIVALNWLIGGEWAVHASCLSSPEICLQLFGR